MNAYGVNIFTDAAKRALEDFEFFARRCVKIRDKDGRVVPFVLNGVQRKLLAAVEERRRAGKPVLVVVLKARQVGISTFIEMYTMWRLLREANKRGLVVAHQKEAARYILGMTRHAVTHLPEWFRAACGVQTEYFTKYEVQFAHNGAGMKIGSAESVEPGRGETLHFLHLSEAAFYPDAGTLAKALLEAVPKTGGTAVFVESTGKEPSGYFYDLWTQAANGLVDYEPVFFPWYEHDEYRMPVPEGYAPSVPENLAPLVEEGKITPEALMWREWVIRNDFMGDDGAFSQEYPTYPDDAFYKPDAKLFPPEAIRARLREIGKPKKGFLVDVGSGPVFREAVGEKLHVYKEPEPGRVYVIGADVGSGVVINREGDYSSADVLDVVTGEQVAHFHALLEPGQYAVELMLLGRWYNDALIAVEVTDGHGLWVANTLRDMGYTALYRRKVYDRTSQQWVDKIGWHTNRSTKKLIIDGLRSDFRNGVVVVNERGTLQEMLTFVKLSDKSDKMGAAAGAKDDRVMSLAVAAQARREAVPQAAVMQATQEPAQEPEPHPWRRRGEPRRFMHPDLGAFY